MIDTDGFSADNILKIEQKFPKIVKRKEKIGQKRGSFTKRSSQITTSTHQKIDNVVEKNQSAFGKANWAQALRKRQKDMNQFYKEQEIGITVNLDHFKLYGPGIYLFFSFLKGLALIFLMMAIISLIPCFYNFLSGNYLFSKRSSFAIYFTKTTVGHFDSADSSSSNKDKLFNTIPSIIIILSFMIFVFYWMYKSNCQVQALQTQVKLKSYSVLQLLNPPKNTTQQQVLNFMNQFGKVIEVAAVKNYDQTILLSKKIFEIELQIEQLYKQGKYGQLDYDQINILKRQVDSLYAKLVQKDNNSNQEIIKFYIIFSSIYEKRKAMKTLKPYLKTFFSGNKDQIPQKYLLNGERIELQSCHTEPGQIIWQNQHITWKERLIRAAIQLLLLFFALTLGFLFISFLNILVPQTSTQYVDILNHNSTSIMSESNKTIVQSWCIQNALDMKQSDDSISNLCKPYIKDYYIKIGIGGVISISIMIIKHILKLFVIFLAKFKRYKSHSQQSKDIVKNLFITYISTTVSIIFFLQAQIFNISLKKLISLFVSNSYLLDNLNKLKEYDDFTTGWYRDIGYKIFLICLVIVVHPALTMPLFDYIYEKYCLYKGQKLDVQGNMQKMIEPPEFQIEDHYANILMITYVSVIFSAGIPLLLILGFFAISFRYLYFKHHFLRYCKIPKVYNQSLDVYVTNMSMYAIILHFMIALWMFGVPSIFKTDKLDFFSPMGSNSNTFLNQIGHLVNRCLSTWYYLCFFLLLLLVIVFKVFIYNLIVKTFIVDKTDNKIRTTVYMQQIGDKQYLDITDSYKMQNNPNYKEIVSILFKKRKFILKVKRNSMTT